MKTAAAILAALMLPLAAAPQSASARWQRILVPPANPTAEQCIVVDADLYAHAAPGLRDVRLVQDGQELPYAMDVSFDTRVGEAAAPPPDDRALYDTVRVIPLRPTPPADSASKTESAPSHQHQWANEVLLSAHIPVERIRLDPAPQGSATVALRAAARMDLRNAEMLHATLTPQHPYAPFTLGANLQDEADLAIRVESSTAVAPSLILEMRRREICYRPRTASPIVLFLGDTTAPPAHYDYALRFQPSDTPLLATLGPMSANPDFRRQPPPAALLRSSATLRITVTLVILVGSLAAVALALYELRRTNRQP